MWDGLVTPVSKFGADMSHTTTCHFLFSLWMFNTAVFLQIPTSLMLLTNIAWDFNSQTLSIFPHFYSLCLSVPSNELTTVCFLLLTACFVVCSACFKIRATTCCGRWPPQSLCHQGWRMLCNNYSIQRGTLNTNLIRQWDEKGVSAHKAALGFILCCLWTKWASRAMIYWAEKSNIDVRLGLSVSQINGRQKMFWKPVWKHYFCHLVMLVPQKKSGSSASTVQKYAMHIYI